MKIDRYAVMGNPIDHSKSPRIHTLFAQQSQQIIQYDALLVAMDGFATEVVQFFNQGGKGLNITVPFKQQAWKLVDEKSPRAECAGAVNTIVLQADGQLFGDNTDGIGLVRDIGENLQIPLANQRILLLGAGGAARGAIAPLLAQKPQWLLIANRTPEKAIALAQHFATLGPISGCGFQDVSTQTFDLVINATAASLNDQVPDIPASVLAPSACCYDMMYAKEATAFQTWARQVGAAQAVDGLGMLVEQAAEAFYLWRGIRPQTKPVIATLRTELRK